MDRKFAALPRPPHLYRCNSCKELFPLSEEKPIVCPYCGAEFKKCINIIDEVPIRRA